MDLHWWSIEVRNGDFAATLWRDAHGEALTETAITNGARGWGWVELPWGIVLEIAFVEDDGWTRFRELPAVRAALDAVPDRVGGLYVYPGRGGSSGAGVPRRPLRPLGAGAAPLPEMPDDLIVAQPGLGATLGLIVKADVRP